MSKVALKRQWRSGYRPWILATLALTGMGLVALKHLLPRSTLHSEAGRLMACAVEGDSDCLYRASWDEEAKNGLNRRSAELIMKNIIVPFWRERKPIGPIMTEGMEMEGVAVQTYKLRNGEQYKRVLVTFSDGRQARTLFFQQILDTFQAMTMERHTRSEISEIVPMMAGLEGIDRYGTELRSYGIVGTASMIQGTKSAEIKIRPFAESRALILERIRKLRPAH